jgi:predicted DNA repair protein MutK
MTGGFFAVLDDIATLLDDAAAMSKIAAKKTAGILGDDLAVNAEKATGFLASRELPVLWAITKGSFLNKLIIVPLALILSAFAPWLIIPILLMGGAYLSYEGVEKIFHVLTQKPHSNHPVAETVIDEAEILKVEKNKIKSAVRTDFILSIEIVVIALGTVMDQSLMMRIIVVTLIAALATIGVYGLVALIVRMDDIGFHLIERAKKLQGVLQKAVAQMGSLLVASLPIVIRTLGIVGTIAMLLVGGGMYSHNIPAIHHAVDFMPLLLANLLLGIVVGGIVLMVQLSVQKIRGKAPIAHAGE